MKEFNRRCLVGGIILGMLLMWTVEKYELNYYHLVKGQHWVRWTEQVPLSSGKTLLVERSIFVVPGKGALAKQSLQFTHGPFDKVFVWNSPNGAQTPVGLYESKEGGWRMLIEENVNMSQNSTCHNYSVFQNNGWEWWGRDPAGLTTDDIARGINLKKVHPETGVLLPLPRTNELAVRTTALSDNSFTALTNECGKL
ncbi:MAG: hypothetical protein Q7S87_10305 [Agitococcus sp.]|nr:hypothetical protein [Agitococcus sp.]